MNMNDPLRGIVHSAPTDGTLSSLPLEKVSINVFMVDVSAHITLRQTFANPSQTSTSRAKYVFPVPARAAVCAFEMQFKDGRIIKGVAKENGQAIQEHEQALNEGKATALVNWVSDDVFTISVGSIPPRQTVTTKLVFVMDLMDDDFKDEVRLQLPLTVGSRYGIEPSELADASAASSQTLLRITADILMGGVIRSIKCPGHDDLTTFTPYVTRTGQTSRRRRTVKMHSPTFLSKDFVLVVRADGLDEPRCFAERDENGSGTIAMQLTWVPNFKLPPIPGQEYLFLIDRSGSMSGSRIDVAKRALIMLLRFLPSAGTTINIVSFGSSFKAFWENGSAEYSNQVLASATKHVEGMDADFGGTELEAALRHTLSIRDRKTPTMLFVLTDGQIGNASESISIVTQAVNISQLDAPLRVFTLGIGNTVSSAVIEGIARAGNGECLFALESEEIVAKCAKLLRVGRSSFLENISIDWGLTNKSPANSDSTRGHTSVIFSNPASPGQFTQVDLAPHDPIQQTPAHIAKISPGMRFVVFVITTERRVPKKVVLKGQLNGGGESFEFEIQVSSVKVFDKRTPDVSLVHTLAARHLITSHMEESTPLPVSINAASPEDIRKAAIIRLGEKYQLASRYTSFVAVDEGLPTPQRSTRGRPISRQSNASPQSLGDVQDKNIIFTVISDILSATWSLFQGGPSHRRRTVRHLPGAFTSSSTSSLSHLPESLDASDSNQASDYDDTDSVSTISSLESCPDCVPPPSRRRRRNSAENEGGIRSPSPTIDIDQFISPTTPPPQESKEVFEIIQLQSHDGSFELSAELGKIVGPLALVKPTDIHIDDKTWATALAAAFLKRHLCHSTQSDLLDGLLEKVNEFVEKESIAMFESLVKRAEGLLSNI